MKERHKQHHEEKNGEEWNVGQPFAVASYKASEWVERRQEDNIASRRIRLRRCVCVWLMSQGLLLSVITLKLSSPLESTSSWNEKRAEWERGGRHFQLDYVMKVCLTRTWTTRTNDMVMILREDIRSVFTRAEIASDERTSDDRKSNLPKHSRRDASPAHWKREISFYERRKPQAPSTYLFMVTQRSSTLELK